MRKLILAGLFLAVLTPAHAQHHGHGGGWFAPFVLGGLAGAMVTAPRYYYTPPPVVYTPPPATYYTPPYPSAYTPVYKQVQVWIPECSCYRTVTVQVN